MQRLSWLSRANLNEKLLHTDAVHTSRPVDFSPPLNQAELHLTQTADLAVRVDVDTETPCFETLMVREHQVRRNL